MNLRELKQVIKAIEHLVPETTRICINESRDGIESYVTANVFLIEDSDGEVLLAWEYE